MKNKLPPCPQDPSGCFKHEWDKKPLRFDVKPDPKPIFSCSCGSSIFFRKYRAIGWWTQCIEATTKEFEVIDTNLDRLKTGREPKYITCADCKKRHPNPQFSP